MDPNLLTVMVGIATALCTLGGAYGFIKKTVNGLEQAQKEYGEHINKVVSKESCRIIRAECSDHVLTGQRELKTELRANSNILNELGKAISRLETKVEILMGERK